MPPRVARIEVRRISALRVHPRWEQINGNVAPARQRVFDEDIAARGVRVMPEALPDNTVIYGWRCLQGARLAGVREIAIRIRYDLADQSPAQIEYDMVADALHQRHRTRLGIASLIQQQCELEVQLASPRGPFNAAAVRAAAKDRIAAYLGITLRSVNLYLRAIAAPKAVQEACDNGLVTLTKTADIGDLSAGVKERVSRLIRGTPTRAAEFVDAALAPRPDTTTGRARLRLFAKSMEWHVPRVRGHLHELTSEEIRMFRTQLRAAQRLIDQLLRRAG